MNHWTNLHGTYIGSRHDLKGQTALLMVADDDHFKAQFDNIKLHKNLSHAWPKFKKSDFRIQREVVEYKDDRLEREKRRNEELAWRLAATKAALTNGRFLG